MLKPKNQVQIDDEIDLIQILQALWRRKLILIIFPLFTLSLGLVYNSNQPNHYSVNIDISEGSDAQFFKYMELNEVLSKNPLPFKDADFERGGKTYYDLTPKNVLEKFALQFSQKKGTIYALSRKPYQELNLNYEQILNKSKGFKLTKSLENSSYSMSFSWPKKNHINGLVNLIISQTLFDVKKEILKDLKLVRQYIKEKQENLLEGNDEKLKVLLLQENDIINSRILFLKEQLSIAIKLGIRYTNFDDKNKLNTGTMILPSKNTPYYLIGYEAISQEIKNLESRSDEDKILLSGDYLKLIKTRRNLESDFSIERFDNALNSFSNDSIDNWVQYDLGFINIINNKKSNFVLILSLLFGLVFGSVFVLVETSIRFTNKR